MEIFNNIAIALISLLGSLFAVGFAIPVLVIIYILITIVSIYHVAVTSFLQIALALKKFTEV